MNRRRIQLNRFSHRLCCHIVHHFISNYKQTIDTPRTIGMGVVEQVDTSTLGHIPLEWLVLSPQSTQ